MNTCLLNYCHASYHEHCIKHAYMLRVAIETVEAVVESVPEEVNQPVEVVFELGSTSVETELPAMRGKPWINLTLS